MTDIDTAIQRTVPSPMPDGAESSFSLKVRLYSDYAQVTDFRLPGVALLALDEPPPLGRAWGPSPLQLLGSAIGSSLGSALLQGLRNASVDVTDLSTEVTGTLGRGPDGRLRLARISVVLTPDVPAAQLPRVRACAALLEDDCVLTASLKDGIDIVVRVRDGSAVPAAAAAPALATAHTPRHDGADRVMAGAR